MNQTKSKVSLTVSKLFHYLKQNHYLNGKNLNDCHLSISGLLLKRNFENEWLLNHLNGQDHSTFVTNDIQYDLDHIKQLCNDSLPVGFVTCTEQHLFSTILCTPAQSLQFYHRWQRLRSRWWRKFSSEPGQFKLTDVSGDKSKNDQIVNIEYEDFLGTTHVAEIVKLSTEQPSFIKTKTTKYHVITNEVELNRAALLYMVDAYQYNSRQHMRFHRKLAPYNFSIAVNSADANNDDVVVEDLKDLALFVARQLREAHISTLLLPNASQLSVDDQCERNDKMGVSYTLIINKQTLNDGVLLMRSRDTTLSEQVHVSKLKSYAELIVKNY